MQGRLRPPSSKSLTQRFYSLALLADGVSTIDDPLRSQDCDAFLAGLKAVGCEVSESRQRVRISAPEIPIKAEVDCAASGTMMRLLAAVLCAVPGEWRLDGIRRLRERPMASLLDALEVLGADVVCLDAPGHAPLSISGGRLAGGRTRIEAHQSSQFVSALMIVGTASERGIRMEIDGLVSAPYLDLTEHAMSLFGAVLSRPEPDVFTVKPTGLRGAHVRVEPDASAACYPAAAAALTGGSVILEGVLRSSVQGDLGFFDLLESMGANIDWRGGGVEVSAGRELRAIQADLSAMPDQVPTLAAVAPFAVGTTVIRGVPHLRLKESDRLAAMATELGRLGVPVVEHDDGLSIEGCWAAPEAPAKAVAVDTHDDHRIAMSCALVGLRRPGVSIGRPEVVAKSYPDFWADLLRLLG